MTLSSPETGHKLDKLDIVRWGMAQLTHAVNSAENVTDVLFVWQPNGEIMGTRKGSPIKGLPLSSKFPACYYRGNRHCGYTENGCARS
jgi:hypothetical protein